MDRLPNRNPNGHTTVRLTWKRKQCKHGINWIAGQFAAERQPGRFRWTMKIDGKVVGFALSAANARIGLQLLFDHYIQTCEGLPQHFHTSRGDVI